MKLEVKHFLVQIIESFAVFDQTGEGFLPIAQLKHLMCTNFGKASWDIIYTFYLYSESESETLNEEDFNFLISHLKKTGDDFIEYKEFAKMLCEKKWIG